MKAFCLAVAVFALSFMAACSTTKDPVPTQPLTEHLTLGNPSGATTDINQPTNYLLSKPQYALSYHRDRGIPTWVSWHLDASWRGSAPRQDDFRADNTLPAGWYQVGGSSYSGSGFDRGHQCPSADRTSTVADNSATFLMTNMVPQAPRNNQQTWANFENYTRTFLSAGNEVYLLCGSYGKGGTGSNGFATTLDQGRVTVPARLWKVVCPSATTTPPASAAAPASLPSTRPTITPSTPTGASTASASTPSKPPPASICFPPYPFRCSRWWKPGSMRAPRSKCAGSSDSSLVEPANCHSGALP